MTHSDGDLHDVERVVNLLELQPHPEGGFFRETFRSSQRVTGTAGARRDASTAIYFLLPAGTFSAFHVIQGADEQWHHYGGDPVELHTIAPDGEHRVAILGPNLLRDERPQLVIPAGMFQAAVPRGSSFALCGCTVTPGFDFADFTMPARDELVRRFPRSKDVILRLTRA